MILYSYITYITCKYYVKKTSQHDNYKVQSQQIFFYWKNTVCSFTLTIIQIFVTKKFLVTKYFYFIQGGGGADVTRMHYRILFQRGNNLRIWSIPIVLEERASIYNMTELITKMIHLLLSLGNAVIGSFINCHSGNLWLENEDQTKLLTPTTCQTRIPFPQSISLLSS